MTVCIDTNSLIQLFGKRSRFRSIAVALEIEKRGGKYRVRSAHTLTGEQFHQRENAAGPGAKLGISRVDPPLQAKTPSRSLGVPHDTPPMAMEPIIARMLAVTGRSVLIKLGEIARIEDDALFAKVLAELAQNV